MSLAHLQAALCPFTAHLAGCDLGDPALAQRLNDTWPLHHPEIEALRALVLAGVVEGWLAPKENAGVRFGRPIKPSPESQGFSVDAVIMDGPGPGHTHPKGEVEICFVLDGEPRFDGNPPGWTVYPPGSWHIPTVSGGKMAILYFLPEGAMRFEAQPG
jgi:hypothetical protein